MLKPLRGSCFQLKESEVLPAMRAWSMMIQFSLLVAMLPYASTTGKRTGMFAESKIWNRDKRIGFLAVPLALFFGFPWCSCLSMDICFVLKICWPLIYESSKLKFHPVKRYREGEKLEDFGGNFHPKRYTLKKGFVTSILTLGARVGEGCEAVLCTWHDLAMLRRWPSQHCSSGVGQPELMENGLFE